jgi:hypothetical protein
MADDIKKQFGKVLTGFDKGVKEGSIKALNKSLTFIKTEVVADLKEITGIKSSLLTPRIRTLRANKTVTQAKLQIATKRGISLAEFKPKVVKVPVGGRKKVAGAKGRPKARTFYGVSVKVGRLPRTIVPGGFLRTVRNGKELVLRRKGEGKYPTEALKTTAALDAAQERQNEYNRRMKEKFLRTVDGEIEMTLAQMLKSFD